MYIYPAIDLYGGKAVRLFKGDYAQMTVYSDDPVSVAKDFAAAGASHIHLVDLEGAKIGKPANLDTIRAIVETTGLFAEVGGGIRDMETVDSYLSIGVSRGILGTAAVKDPEFLQAALAKYSEKISVGVDLKDGFVAIKGWTETSDLKVEDFFAQISIDESRLTALGLTNNHQQELVLFDILGLFLQALHTLLCFLI